MRFFESTVRARTPSLATRVLQQCSAGPEASRSRTASATRSGRSIRHRRNMSRTLSARALALPMSIQVVPALLRGRGPTESRHQALGERGHHQRRPTRRTAWCSQLFSLSVLCRGVPFGRALRVLPASLRVPAGGASHRSRRKRRTLPLRRTVHLKGRHS
jgi:hypothetical protein